MAPKRKAATALEIQGEEKRAKRESPETVDGEIYHFLVSTEGGNNKFYEVSLHGRSVSLRHGRIGTEGVCSEKNFTDENEARQFAEKTVLEKRKKGYKEAHHDSNDSNDSNGGNDGNPAALAALITEKMQSTSNGDPLADLEAGRAVYVQGRRPAPYKLKKFPGGYSCTCPGWGYACRKKGLQTTTCKHLKEIRGFEAEELRCCLHAAPVATATATSTDTAAALVAPGAAIVVTAGKNASVPGKISLANVFDPSSQNPTGYYMSEKLDGMRAYWTEGKLWTRDGNEIIAPAWFVAGLPVEEDLDGEIFLDRQRFGDCMSIARRTDASEDWRQLRYLVFDCPSAAGGIEERLLRAEQLLSPDKTPFAALLPQAVCESKEHLLKELAKVVSVGGEGVMLRHPTAKHRGGRSDDLLKVKNFLDDEALVIGYEAGRGKYEGMVGSLVCIDKKGTRFKVGSGLTDAMREYGSAPKKGSVITFKYFELTKDGIPRFPTFMRVRPDVEASAFPV